MHPFILVNIFSCTLKILKYHYQSAIEVAQARTPGELKYAMKACELIISVIEK